MLIGYVIKIAKGIKEKRKKKNSNFCKCFIYFSLVYFNYK